MIVIIRIHGKVNIKREIEETLKRLRLGRKYACSLISEKDKSKMGMLKKVVSFVAFGEIEKSVLMRLIEKRGKILGENKSKKIDAGKIAEEILNGGRPEKFGIKPFFRLHSPRGGIKSSRKQFPKGVLGNHKKEINKLIEKML